MEQIAPHMGYSCAGDTHLERSLVAEEAHVSVAGEDPSDGDVSALLQRRLGSEIRWGGASCLGTDPRMRVEAAEKAVPALFEFGQNFDLVLQLGAGVRHAVLGELEWENLTKNEYVIVDFRSGYVDDCLGSLPGQDAKYPFQEQRRRKVHRAVNG